MPQVQFLEAPPSFSGQLAQGITKGLAQGINSFFEEKKQIQNNRPLAQKQLYSLFKQYGANESFDDAQRRKAEEVMDDYVKQGINPFDAAKFAFNHMEAGFPGAEQEGQGAEGQQKQQDATGIGDQLRSLVGKGTEALKGLKQSGSDLMEQKRNRLQALKLGPDPKLMTKPIIDMTVDELFRMPQERFEKLTPDEQGFMDRKIEEAGERESYASFAKGLIPGYEALENKFQQSGLTPHGQLGSETVNDVLKVGGEVAKDFALFGLATGSTVPLRAGQAAVAFGGEKALNKTLNEGRGLGTEDIPDVLGAAALGAGGEVAVPIMEALFRQVDRIPGIAKSIAEAIGGKGPKGPKPSGGGPGAAQAGPTAEAKEFMQEAAQAAQARGVNLEKVAQGDAASLNAFQREVKNTSDLWKKAEKFNQKELEKVRKEVAEKISESPLEKYYEPKKEPGPKAQASKEIRNAPLKEKVAKLEEQLGAQQRAVLRSETALRNGKPENQERLKALFEADTLAHQKTLNEIRNTEFEMKYGRPPQTSDQIQKQIEETFAKIREGIKDPNAEKVADIKRRIDLDKEAIETAQKLIARGEIPGGEVFDEYIKIHEQYNKAYGDLINELKEFVKANKGKPRMGKKVENAENLINLVKDMKAAGEAKVVNQIDKRKAMRAIDKPSGAFYRNMLRDVKKDIGEFQKNYFRSLDITAPEAAKTAEVAKQKITPSKEAQPLRSSEKVGEQAKKTAENPNVTNKEKLSEETGIPKEKLGDMLKRQDEAMKGAASKVSEGTATNEDIQKTSKGILDIYKGLGKFPKQLVNAVVLGFSQGSLEHFTGIKLPLAIAPLITKTQNARSLSSAGLAGLTYKWTRDFYEWAEANKLRKYRNTPKFNEYRKELERRYDQSKANRIVKKAIQR